MLGSNTLGEIGLGEVLQTSAPIVLEYFPGQDSDTAQRYAHDSGSPNGFEITNVYVGYDGTYFYKNWPGFRFPGVTIAAGSVISSAILTLQVDINEQGSGPFGTLFGYDADNPATFDATNNPTVAPHTAASVSITASNRGSIDVTAIVQEIVDRGGWVSGNAIAFVGDPPISAGNYTSWVARVNGGIHVLSIVVAPPPPGIVVEAVAGHVLIHGYAGSVLVSDNKSAIAVAGSVKVHGYPANVNVSDNKVVVAQPGHIKVHGYAGSVSIATASKVCIAIAGHAKISGFAGRVLVSTTIPPKDRTIKVEKENRTIALAKENRTITISTGTTTITAEAA